MKRFFSKKQKDAVSLVTGQEGAGDHIIPHSKGGETSVENCQLISKEANSKKSDFEFKPRIWQSELFKKYNEREQNIPFSVIAIPGGGKTMAALELARRWRAAGSDRRIIIVVPTDNLREQWRDEAMLFGFDLQTKEFGTDFKHGFQGAVATYSLVANQSLIFSKLCSVAPTMVIFDEIHHCGESAHFGIGVQEAFQLAKEKLLLSGTPWKTDGSKIPFIRYDGNGYAVADFSYDYPRALKEEVVRYITFDFEKGSVYNETTGSEHEISQESTKDQAKKHLKNLLNAEGDYVYRQIENANRKLDEVRKQIPDAGGLAACIDQKHAHKIAEVIYRVSGEMPSVILSDTETDSVKSFRNSTKKWLVAVRKVSEGTDIKRLQVLCYLTNTTSELFFRQLIGRVSRVRNIEDYEAHVYLPADPRLIACAKNIENAQMQALKEPSEETDPVDLEHEFDDEKITHIYSTTHGGSDFVLINGKQLPVDDAKRVEDLSQRTGIPMHKVMELAEMLNHDPINVKKTEPAQEKTKEERMDDLRKRASKLAFKLSKLEGVEVRDIHIRYKKQQDCSEQELREKIDDLLKGVSQWKVS